MAIHLKWNNFMIYHTISCVCTILWKFETHMCQDTYIWWSVNRSRKCIWTKFNNKYGMYRKSHVLWWRFVRSSKMYLKHIITEAARVKWKFVTFLLDIEQISNLSTRMATQFAEIETSLDKEKWYNPDRIQSALYNVTH